jgi:hypothetical protein
MGPLPDHRVEIGAIFQSVAIDLFGPIEYQGTVSKRQLGLGMGGSVCLHHNLSSAHRVRGHILHRQLLNGPLAIHVPKRGSVALPVIQGGAAGGSSQASHYVGFQRGSTVAGKKGIKWVLVPTGGQHFNGQAERMIRLIKRQIWRSFEGKKYSHEETVTILQEAAQVINSRPLGCNPWPEGEPLCPQELMLGRARPGQPAVKLETGCQLTWRFENLQWAKEEFWSRWIREVFPALLKQKKWLKYRRDVRVGDMVLRKDETAAGQTYKYARVVKVHVGTDGKVRAADIENKIPGEVRFRVTTRPIHKMVLIIPMEERMTESSEEEMEATELEPQNQDREVSNGVQGEEEDKTPQVRGAAGTNPSSTKEPKRRPDQEAKHKETGPQRGARRQAQAVIRKGRDKGHGSGR